MSLGEPWGRSSIDIFFRTRNVYCKNRTPTRYLRVPRYIANVIVNRDTSPVNQAIYPTQRALVQSFPLNLEERSAAIFRRVAICLVYMNQTHKVRHKQITTNHQLGAEQV